MWHHNGRRVWLEYDKLWCKWKESKKTHIRKFADVINGWHLKEECLSGSTLLKRSCKYNQLTFNKASSYTILSREGPAFSDIIAVFYCTQKTVESQRKKYKTFH